MRGRRVCTEDRIRGIEIKFIRGETIWQGTISGVLPKARYCSRLTSTFQVDLIKEIVPMVLRQGVGSRHNGMISGGGWGIKIVGCY